MVHIITDISDPLLDLVRDDPVRPELDRDFRVATNRFVAAWLTPEIGAMTCVSLQTQIPRDLSELGRCDPNPCCAVFYSIWSYVSGSGSKLLFATRDQILLRWPMVKRFVTLSPTTEMAQKFHLRNGARICRVNTNSINYEYESA